MAWYFNAADSRVTIPTGTYLDLGGSGWTLCLFAKILGTGLPDGSQQHYFISRSGVGLSTPNQPTLRINESTNTVTWAVWDSNSNSMTVANIPGTGNEWSASGWFHVGVTMSSDHATSRTGDLTKYTNFYINGDIIGSDSLNGFSILTGVNLLFGRRGDVATTNAVTTLTGCLAEFCKFDRVLSKTEMRQIYRGHDPELLPNGPPTVYFPMRNDFVERRLGITGVQVGVFITGDHPISDKVYISTTDRQVTLPQLDGRVGQLEGRGFLDFVYWTPGGVPPSGISQTGALFSQARLGDGYIVAPNRSLSGCTVSCYASGGTNNNQSGILQMIVTNMTPLPIDLSGQVRFSIYRL
jgi:hypothetical protein